MTRLREWLERPEVTLGVRAFTLGAGAVWSISGRFALARAAALLIACVAVHVTVNERAGALWGFGLVPVLVAAGWFSGHTAFHWDLAACCLLVALQVWPGVWFGLDAHQAPANLPVLVIVSVYVVLGASMALGAIPVWGALTLLALPAAIRILQQEDGCCVEGRAWRTWLFVFNGQLLLGYLMKGLVR